MHLHLKGGDLKERGVMARHWKRSVSGIHVVLGVIPRGLDGEA